MKILYVFILISLLLFSSCSISNEQINSTTDEENNFTYSCPRGEVNCEYPGKCPLYTDTNGNNICDNGEI